MKKFLKSSDNKLFKVHLNTILDDFFGRIAIYAYKTLKLPYTRRGVLHTPFGKVLSFMGVFNTPLHPKNIICSNFRVIWTYSYGLVFALALTACTDTPPQTQTNSNTTANTISNQKILALDWGVAGTLTAMGVPPVATGDLAGYPDWAIEPALPDSVLDMGSRFSPNPELLAQMPIDTIIDTDFYQHLRSKYGNARHINFVVEGTKTNPDGTPKTRYSWDDYAGAVVKLGVEIGHKDKAVAYVQHAKTQIIAHGNTFKQNNPNYPKLAIVQFADSKNLRMYTPNSLFAPVAELMGVELVTMGVANPWGYANLTLGDLAKLDNDTCLIVIEPFSPMLQSELNNTALWQRLGFGKNGERCMAVLPPVWTFGGVPSMVGFSEQLAKQQLGKVATGDNDD